MHLSVDIIVCGDCKTAPNPSFIFLRQAREAEELMRVLPVVSLRATCEVEGETEIMEQDVAKCKVRLRGLGRQGRVYWGGQVKGSQC